MTYLTEGKGILCQCRSGNWRRGISQPPAIRLLATDNHSHNYGGNHGYSENTSNKIILHPRGAVRQRAEAAANKAIPFDRAVVANHLTNAADLLSCAIDAYRRCPRLTFPRR